MPSLRQGVGEDHEALRVGPRSRVPGSGAGDEVEVTTVLATEHVARVGVAVVQVTPPDDEPDQAPLASSTNSRSPLRRLGRSSKTAAALA